VVLRCSVCGFSDSRPRPFIACGLGDSTSFFFLSFPFLSFLFCSCLFSVSLSFLFATHSTLSFVAMLHERIAKGVQRTSGELLTPFPFLSTYLFLLCFFPCFYRLTHIAFAFFRTRDTLGRITRMFSCLALVKLL